MLSIIANLFFILLFMQPAQINKLVPVAQQLIHETASAPLSSVEKTDAIVSSIAKMDVALCSLLNPSFKDKPYPLLVGTPTKYLPNNIINKDTPLPPSINMNKSYLVDNLVLTRKILANVDSVLATVPSTSATDEDDEALTWDEIEAADIAEGGFEQTANDQWIPDLDESELEEENDDDDDDDDDVNTDIVVEDATEEQVPAEQEPKQQVQQEPPPKAEEHEQQQKQHYHSK